MPGEEALEVIEPFLPGDQGVSAEHRWSVLFPGISVDEIRSDFVWAWENIRSPIEEDVLSFAVQCAQRVPLPVESRIEGYRNFIATAGWLQVIVGDRPIILPTRRMADMLAVTPVTVSHYISKAIKDGFLQIKRRGTFKGRKAGEYRFSVEAFDALASGVP